VLGSLLLYTPTGPRSPTLPDARVALPVLLVAAGTGVLLSLLVLGAAIRVGRRPAISEVDRLVGATGVTRSALDPTGVVYVGGQLWSARLRSGRLGPGEPSSAGDQRGGPPGGSDRGDPQRARPDWSGVRWRTALVGAAAQREARPGRAGPGAGPQRVDPGGGACRGPWRTGGAAMIATATTLAIL